MTISYTLRLLYSLLSSLTKTRLTIFALLLARKLSNTPLLPGETVIASVTPSTNSKVYRAQTSARALSALIDDFRIFTRLWGLLGIWAWGSSTWYSSEKDNITKSIVWAQVSVNAAFQFLENGAYLASKGVLAWNTSKINKWYLWSSRFWAMHVFLEFARLARFRSVNIKKIKTDYYDDHHNDDNIDDKINAAWWRDFYVNTAWMPMTWHYSIDGGIIGEGVVASLGLVAGILGLEKAWKVTA
jgi:hypothetical protein